MQAENEHIYYQALLARDARFDGRIFIAVKSTGIYCRPICPAPKPKQSNCLYYKSAAAAKNAGFRPCKRCKPETAPNSPAWSGTESTVRRALRLIADGALKENSIEQLACRLGVSDRHLRRLFKEHLGATPLAVAQTQRLHLAKQLLERTELSMTDVAFGAGYASQRRFNEEIGDVYKESPRALRKKWRRKGGADAPINLKLGVRGAMRWEPLRQFFSKRAIKDVECVNESYCRSIKIGNVYGIVTICPSKDSSSVSVNLRISNNEQLLPYVERLRLLFDLDADLDAIERDLSTDKRLKKLIHKNRGLRVPGAWDSYEVCIRAILGQQVTLKAAQTFLNRLCEKYGSEISCSELSETTPRRLFPTPEQIAEADMHEIGLTNSRLNTVRLLSKAFAEKKLVIDHSMTADDVIAGLKSIKGIGNWTANYVAMRALKYPDAFPEGDAGLLIAAKKHKIATTHVELKKAAEHRRPWRSYAAMHLWNAM